MKPLASYWQAWLARRTPTVREKILDHSCIYIRPNKTGMLFLLLLVVLLLTAINYQNSLIFALTFWLFGIALLAMLLTFKNLSTLTLRAQAVQPVFVGSELVLPIELYANTDKIALAFFFKGQQRHWLTVSAQREHSLRLSLIASKRGRFDAAPFCVESRFPLGLFTAWSWVRLDFQTFIYPKPVDAPFLAQDDGRDEGENTQKTSSGTTIYGLKPYQAGDALRLIAWKHFARGQGLLSKEFEGQQNDELRFDFAALTGHDSETRLSILCAWVLKAQEFNRPFSLALPNYFLPADEGAAQVQRALTALALFGSEDD